MIYCFGQWDKTFQTPELELGDIHEWEGGCPQAHRDLDIAPHSDLYWASASILQWLVLVFGGSQMHPLFAVNQGEAPCLKIPGRYAPTTPRIGCA